MIGYFETEYILAGFVMAAIFGLHHGMTITAQRTMVSRYASEQLRATAFGVYYLFVGLSFLVANITFGFLWEAFSSQTAFEYSIATSLIGIVLLFGFILKNNHSNQI